MAKPVRSEPHKELLLDLQRNGGKMPVDYDDMGTKLYYQIIYEKYMTTDQVRDKLIKRVPPC